MSKPSALFLPDYKMSRYVGHLARAGQAISSSMPCIVYDHQNDRTHLATDNPALAAQVALAQNMESGHKEFVAYQLIGETWTEIRVG